MMERSFRGNGTDCAHEQRKKREDRITRANRYPGRSLFLVNLYFARNEIPR